MDFFRIALLCATLTCINACGQEEALEEVHIKIENHHFIPSHITIRAQSKIRLVVNNQDNSAEEFESFDLKRETIIPANTTGKIIIGPLAKGRYKFFGEFHEQTAQGVINVE